MIFALKPAGIVTVLSISALVASGCLMLAVMALEASFHILKECRNQNDTNK